MKIEFRTLLDDRRRAPASAIPKILAVDPGIRQSGFPRLDVVVKEALCHMQDTLGRGAKILLQMLQHVLEIAWVRLVAADTLGRVDRVEFDAELPVRGRETIAMHI